MRVVNTYDLFVSFHLFLKLKELLVADFSTHARNHLCFGLELHTYSSSEMIIATGNLGAFFVGAAPLDKRAVILSTEVTTNSFSENRLDEGTPPFFSMNASALRTVWGTVLPQSSSILRSKYSRTVLDFIGQGTPSAASV